MRAEFFTVNDHPWLEVGIEKETKRHFVGVDFQSGSGALEIAIKDVMHGLCEWIALQARKVA